MGSVRSNEVEGLFLSLSLIAVQIEVEADGQAWGRDETTIEVQHCIRGCAFGGMDRGVSEMRAILE